MKIAITTRGYKAPERLKKYINDKVKRLDRFADRILDFEAVLSYEKLDQVVEFKLRLGNKRIIVKERSEDVFKSIDLAIDNLERQITKVKEKYKGHDNKKIVELVS
ncbi:MAG TPA: ribosome-associated translation inhibitor RaiA [Caldithrix abyssi]|uniref:Ribosome hibernation promoting factor n=1 Tax=Caldithrix abyssi TaxID=187145 RepID=A0A7V5PN81_CALAY|nr:ribosome-associated translation inhibitor RaiA [Caldithrix abyssi]